MRIWRHIPVILLFLSPVWGMASHLVGGNLGYEYIGDQGGGMYRYRIELTTYNNCDAASQIPLPVASQDIWIYEHDLTNNPMGGGDKTYWGTVTLNLIDSSKIEPSNPSGCAVGAGTCFYKGVYEGVVDLPLNFNGYHLVFDDFARNAAIDNLNNPGGTGMAFHAYIPPNIVDNSSPQFSDDPIPFICVNDTTSLLNTAIDPDGDLLTFSFVTPFAGVNGFGGPPMPLPWTINPVVYNGGYSVAQPFGAGGYSFINGSTGLTEYMSTATGNYVVAVEIREFRNGNLIGITRRDLQLLVINCPNNPSPNLDPTTQQINFNIQEGDSLCFDITFDDPNGDSIHFEASGQLFDPTFTSPPATITTPVDGNATVTSQFCWNTDCGQASALPYLFTVSAQDNGCPPKTTNVVYSIQVDPYPPPTAINGPVLICENDTAVYVTDDLAGATYDWSVTNGSIESGQGNDTVTVVWNSPGTGNIEVFATGPLGCPSEPIDLDVTILAEPFADAGVDTTLCLGDSVQIGGSPTGLAGSTFTWTPGSSLDDPSAANPWASPTSTTTYVVEVDNGSCSKTDTVVVQVTSANINAGADTSVCAGDTAQLNATGGLTYTWTPTDSINDPNIANPLVWPSTTTDYVVNGSDGSGCPGRDTITVNVFSLPPADAGPDTSACQGSGVVIGGGPTGPPGATYTWTPAGTLDDPTLANPTATPTLSPTTYIVEVNLGSCQNSDTVNVTIDPLPIADAGLDATICEGDCSPLSASGGTNYSWTPVTGLSDPSVFNPDACPTSTTTYSVTVTDANGCQDSDDVTINVNSSPTVDAGLDQTICPGGSVSIGGSPTGPAGSTYSWSPATGLNDPSIANPIASPGSTTTYTVTVTDANGCESTDDIVVTVSNLPTVDAGPDQTVCAGDSAQIGGSPTGPAGSTYSWAPAASLSNSTAANPNAGPASTTTYTVTVTDANGCIDTDDVTVSVNNLPVADAGPDMIICIGDTVQIGGSPSGPVGSTFGWSPPAFVDDPSLANPQAFPNDTTDFILTVTDGNGCSQSDTMNITVNTLPIIDPGQDTAICMGDSVQLGGSPTGPAGSVYSWTPAASLDDNSLSNPMAGPSATTTYTVVVSDANGCVDSANVDVVVHPLPVVDPGPDTSICLNDSVQIGGSPTGPAGSAFVWSPAASLDNNLIANPNAGPVVSTTYTVVVTDANGCVDSNTVDVAVNSLPIADAGPDQVICLGDTVQIGGSPSGPVGSSFEWSPLAFVDDPAIANPQAFPNTTTDFVLTVTDGNGCSQNDTMAVTVNPLPVVDPGSDATICVNDTIQIGGSPTGPAGSSYSWTPVDSLDDPTIANPQAFPAVTTTYTVVVTDANGCVDSGAVNITVNPLPVADAGADTTICSADSVTIGGSPTGPAGSTYSWSPTTDLDDPLLSNPTTGATSSTTYIVTVTDVQGCSQTDTVQVNISSPPPVDAGNDTTICMNDTLSLGGSPTSSGGNTFAWSPAGSMDDSTLANPMAFPDTATAYIVVVTDPAGCSSTDTVVVDLDSLPTVDAGPDEWLCPGDMIGLNAQGSGSFVWTPSTGLSNPNINNPTANPADTTTYVVTLTDANNCSNTDTLTIFVNDAVPVDAGLDTTICEGDTAQLGGTPTSPAPGTIYSWSPAASLDNASAANPLAFPTTTTTYYVFVTNDTCTNIDSITIFVNPSPSVNAGPDVQYCAGDSAQLNGSGAVNYQWTPSSGLSNDTIADPFASPTDTTTYILTGTDANGCSSSDTVDVIVNPLPNIIAGPDTTICGNDTIQLSANGANTYAWEPAQSLDDSTLTNPMAFPSTTTDYVVFGTDTNGCVSTDTASVTVVTPPAVNAGPDQVLCIGDTAFLAAGGAASYTWSPTDSLSDPNISNPVAWPSDTTTYVVTGTDANGCTGTDTVLVIVNPLPVVDAGADTSICIGDTAQLNGTGGMIFNWSPSASLDNSGISNPLAFPDATTDYILTVSDANDCVNSDTVTVTVLSLPSIDAGPDANICLGDTAQLDATGTGSFDWNPSTDMDNSNFEDPQVWPDTTTTFVVTLTDGNGCTNSDSAVVIVFRIQAIPDTGICVGDSVQLYVTGGAGQTFNWVPPAGLDDPNSATPWASPQSTTTYTVSVTSSSGCSDVSSVTVTVNSAPTAGLAVVWEPGCMGVTGIFENTSTGSGSYLWSFGDGTTSTTNEPEHTFEYNSVGDGYMVAINSFGCSDTAYFSETFNSFKDYFDFEIPNVFSPNGDGVNDQWKVDIQEDLKECTHIEIRNRWGQLMFVGHSIPMAWDGRTQAGQIVPDGTYFYTININGIEFNGFVSLFR